jgi:dipeptidyl aminopeptidase/acylaminoacyl peptidase
MAPSLEAPYGSWPSPISLDVVTAKPIDLRYSCGQAVVDATAIYWVEGRPWEGRSALVRWTAGAGAEDVTPAGYSVRSRVHEYGGGDFTAAAGVVFFSNESDQRLYRRGADGAPVPLTLPGKWRYADPVFDGLRRRLICVGEDHSAAGGPENALVTLSAERPSAVMPLVRGEDFYSSPRLSPDGRSLAWLSWSHPNMPWDGTELWIGRFDEDGAVREQRCIAGGASESIFQPEWSPDGALYFVSDRSGWWNIYRWRGSAEPLLPLRAEFGAPQWAFGMSTYGFVSDREIACAYADNGSWRLGLLDTHGARFEALQLPFTDISAVRTGPRFVCFRGGSPTQVTALVRLDLRTRAIEVLRGGDAPVDAGVLSVPEPTEFESDGQKARAFYYRPRSAGYRAPAGQRPPLLVVCHGGPTGAASTSLDLKIQYWTSRGIGVVDVDYRGSTGYGREYRELLNGQWGVADVSDCVNAARFLAASGAVDARRLAIRGSSAGGYTALCALTFHDLLRAGAVYYGISDVEALARETHKFESRYTDRLIAPYPEGAEEYRRRSPIHFVERLSCPLIFFQGLDDKVVPPAQAERMVEALRAKRLPVAYLTFAGEGHGFRRAETVRRALAAETYFYSRIFGFEPADPVEPIAIENLTV